MRAELTTIRRDVATGEKLSVASDQPMLIA
jgi:hypothetical protein